MQSPILQHWYAAWSFEIGCWPPRACSQVIAPNAQYRIGKLFWLWQTNQARYRTAAAADPSQLLDGWQSEQVNPDRALLEAILADIGSGGCDKPTTTHQSMPSSTLLTTRTHLKGCFVDGPCRFDARLDRGSGPFHCL